MIKAFVAVLALSVIMAFVFCDEAWAEGGPFGLGIILGEPTGISGKYYLNETHAIDGAVAWSLSGDNDFHLHGDYLFHEYSLIEPDKGKLPVYVGIGGRFLFRQSRDTEFGVRIPVGLNYIFATIPIDLFGEIVPILDLFPDVEFDLEGAIGARFYF